MQLQKTKKVFMISLDAAPLSSPNLLNELKSDTLNYGNVTLIGEIDHVSKDIILNGTNIKCKGGVIGKSIIAHDARALRMIAKKDINLTCTTSGDVNSVGGNILVEGCQKLRNLKAGEGYISANNCQKIEGVWAKGNITLQNCPLVNSACTEEGITLKNTNIMYSVQAKGAVKLFNSRVRRLECSLTSTMPEITDSVIYTLDIKYGVKPKGSVAKYVILPNGQPKEKIASSSIGNKFVIKLINCIVNEVIFEKGIIGEVVLAGTSQVKKVLNGIARQETAEDAQDSDTNFSRT